VSNTHVSHEHDPPTSDLAEDEEDELIEYIQFNAFGHQFSYLLPGHAEDLITLEKEGAIYDYLYNEETGQGCYFRIRLLPSEIVQFVEASVAHDQFHAVYENGGSTEEAFAAIPNRHVRELGRTYAQGLRGFEGAVIGCLASFMPMN